MSTMPASNGPFDFAALFADCEARAAAREAARVAHIAATLPRRARTLHRKVKRAKRQFDAAYIRCGHAWQVPTATAHRAYRRWRALQAACPCPPEWRAAPHVTAFCRVCGRKVPLPAVDAGSNSPVARDYHPPADTAPKPMSRTQQRKMLALLGLPPISRRSVGTSGDGAQPQ